LTDSLTKPGTTVITPGNVPAFAPDVLTKDGRIKVTDPKAPDEIKKLAGAKAPTPVIQNGRMSVDVPMNLGKIEVTLRVENGRILADTKSGGAIKVLEDAASFARDMKIPGVPDIDVGRSVQRRIDRYNNMIAKAKLEVKQVIADGGQIRVVTGPKS
jgi:hypothetical protein